MKSWFVFKETKERYERDSFEFPFSTYEKAKEFYDKSVKEESDKYDISLYEWNSQSHYNLLEKNW